MIKTIAVSSNKKLGGCAATYRSGTGNVYSTCPSSCPLKPSHSQGSDTLDTTYLEAVLRAVPEGGSSWTYTHFDRALLRRSTASETVINISTDSDAAALQSIRDGWPTVVVKESEKTEKVDVVDGVRFVRCPAEYQENITCSNCGGDTPLCARLERDYVIKFTAHGQSQKKVSLRATGQNSESGGCYGSGGPVAIQWKKTMGPTENDAETLLNFVRALPVGTKLRHHVVGDLG